MSIRKMYEIYMLFIGVAGQFIYIAQSYRIFTTKSAHDVSMFGFVCGLIAACSWLIYGIMIKNTPVAVSNVVAVIAAISVVVGIALYG